MPLTARQRNARNLKPHKAAVAAMWFYSHVYIAQKGGAMDFWDKLPAAVQDQCRRLVKEIEAAQTEKE